MAKTSFFSDGENKQIDTQDFKDLVQKLEQRNADAVTNNAIAQERAEQAAVRLDLATANLAESKAILNGVEAEFHAEAQDTLTAAAASASTASTKASEAATSAANANTYKNAAQTARANADTAKTGAETARTAAQAAQAASEAARDTSVTKAGEAGSSASAAAQSATNAATSESNAAQSAANAATSATQATTNATNAANAVLGSKADLASPTFTGDPKAPTAVKTDNDTSIATTAHVKLVVADYATKASPALTGTPTAPTATAATNNTQLATTAFANAAASTAAAGVTKATLGIANVDNTSDANKPVSTAQQTALNLKADTSALNALGIGVGPLPTVTDIDSVLTLSGVYRVDLSTAGTRAEDYGVLSVLSQAGPVGNSNWSNQIFYGASGKSYVRTNSNRTGWSPWRNAFQDNNGSLTIGSLNSGHLAGYRNVIINGCMRVAQRPYQQGGGYQNVDRWLLNVGGTNPTMGQYVGENLLAPIFTTVMRIQGAAGNLDTNLVQRIESLNCRHMAGQWVTLSYWVYQDTGTTRYIRSSLASPTNGIDQFQTLTMHGESANVAVPTNTWTKLIFTTQLNYTARHGISVNICIAIGSILAGQSYSVGNVQLELGTIATPFENRPMEVEEDLCRRYFERINMPAQFTGGGAGTAAAYYMPVFFKTVKRTPPTINLPGVNMIAWDTNGMSVTPYTFAPRDIGVDGFTVWGEHQNRVSGFAAGTYYASAEL